MQEIKVFGSRLSPFVEKLVRGLQLKGVPFELVDLNPLEIRRRNPQTGKIPFVEVDGRTLYDTTFILRWLDEQQPEPPLVSSDPMVAASQRQLEDWADEALYWYVMALSWSPANRGANARRILGGVPALLRPLLAPIVARNVSGLVNAQGMGRLPVATLEKEFGDRLDDLQRMLGDRPFFYSDRPSVADLAVYGQLHGAAEGVSPEARRALQKRPRLLEHLKHVEQATGG